MKKSPWVVAVISIVVVGCPGPTTTSSTLFVSLLTDLVAGEEFDQIAVRVVEPSSSEGVTVLRAYEAPIDREEAADVIDGALITELPVSPGQVYLEVALSLEGSTVASQPVLVRVDDEAYAVTVLVTRDCAERECPGTSDGADQTACIGSRCVDPQCTPERPELCRGGLPTCSTDEDCESAFDTLSECSVVSCRGGICFPSGDSCPEGQYCGSDGECATVAASPQDMDGDGFQRDVDCNDNDPDTHPGAEEICDGLNQDCDDSVDEGLPTAMMFRDADMDGYGEGTDGTEVCIGRPGFADLSGDCPVPDPSLNPSATEVCDAIDQDCDGSIDEESLCPEGQVCAASLGCLEADAPPSSAPTDIGDGVVVWSEGVTNVSSDLRIDDDATLVLGPGVTLTFAPTAELIVDGDLIMVGTEASPVVLQGSPDWLGVSGHRDTTTGAFVVIRGAARNHFLDLTGAHLENNTLALDESSCRHCTLESNLVAFYDSTLRDSLVFNNTHLCARMSGGEVAGGCSHGGSLITSVARDNVHCSLPGSVGASLVRGCSMSLRGGLLSLIESTIALNDVPLETFLVSGTNNTLCDDSDGPLSVILTSDEESELTHSFWCTSDRAAIEAAIVDDADDPALGPFAFEPFRTEPAPNAPPIP